jgi:hypothetical protein
MNRSDIKNRIVALVLTGVMALSMTGYAFESVYAENQDDQAASNAVSSEEAPGDGAEGALSEDSGDLSAAGPAAEGTDATDDAALQTAGDGDGTEPVAPPAPTEPTEPEKLNPLGKITLSAAGEDGTIKVKWKAYVPEQAIADQYNDIYYRVFLDDDETGTDKQNECSYTFTNVAAGVHKVTVRAYSTRTEQPETPDAQTSQDEGGQEGGDGGQTPEPVIIEVQLAEGVIENIPASSRNRLSGEGVRGASNLGINLKTMLGEPHNGYSVAQGGCTDGTYIYYMLVSSANQNGRILKLRKSDLAVVGRSGVIDIEHGNGMAFDSAHNRLVISNREGWRNTLITVDAGSLGNVQYHDVKYAKTEEDKNTTWYKTRDRGISSLTYIPRYHCYIALQRESHDILALDEDFNVIAFIGTTITKKYPGTYQAIDADDRYVYILLSYYNSNQPYNMMLALDWNAENLGILKEWKCKNDGSGTPDAAIRINSPHEAENLVHFTRADGTSDFYLAEYFNNHQTRTVKKQVEYKVKWKKVWKKVKVKKKYKKRVKWKKVRKKNGKWKWKYKKVTKYKYVKKRKKVWKYKTKTKTVKVKEGYYNRDNYVYYIGNF